MVFSADDRVLIKVLRPAGERIRCKEMHRGISKQAMDTVRLKKLLRKIDAYGTIERKLAAEHFHQVFVDEAIRQWRPRLPACIRAHGGHFEHIF